MDRKIDKTHWQQPKKVHSELVRQGDNLVTMEQVEQAVAARPKDRAPHDPKKYYYPIFSNHLGGYQMDLLEQSKDRDKEKYPAYYLIFINTNTRWADAIPVESKSFGAIRQIVVDFCKRHKVASLVHDEEAAFCCHQMQEELKKIRVSSKIITEQRHSALGTIDRFIRTLRDMNKVGVESKRQSDNPKYRDFTPKRMAKLLDIYNHTPHDATGKTPQEMQYNPALEKEYIIKTIYKRERRRKITDFELKEDTFVRYILPRNRLTKDRYKVSPEAYKIAGKEGNAYILTAEDGSTRLVSRWRLFAVGESLEGTKLKWGHSFDQGGAVRGVVNRILDHKPNKNKYYVEFSMPDGSVYNDWIPVWELRGANRQVLSPLEEEFFNRNKK